MARLRLLGMMLIIAPWPAKAEPHTGLYGAIFQSSEERTLHPGGNDAVIQISWSDRASRRTAPPRLSSPLTLRAAELRDFQLDALAEALGDDLRAAAFMAKGNLAFTRRAQWAAYLGGGAGFLRTNLATLQGSDLDGQFACQVASGLRFAPDQAQGAFAVEFNYTRTEDFDLNGAVSEIDVPYSGFAGLMSYKVAW